ncbi:uncharacterized protein LOC141630718 [Silene latifolia]|uniref:uncharacterized protein LOC141630718 n=1 Tax=Silene latifolia TaxID=37657 RepID=UPI003D7728B3
MPPPGVLSPPGITPPPRAMSPTGTAVGAITLVGLGALTPSFSSPYSSTPPVLGNNQGEQFTNNAPIGTSTYSQQALGAQFRPIVNAPPLPSGYVVPPYVTGGAPVTGSPSGFYSPVHNIVVGTSTSVEQQLQELRVVIGKVPGMPPPMEMAAPESYANSPFVDSIALVSVPKGFTPPNMSLYDGTTDPLDYVNHYMQKMMVVTTTGSLKEACMRKGFRSTLSGAALQWFVSLPNKSISTFADLVNAFNQQFTSSRKPEKQTRDLYRIVQRFEESTRDYQDRFNIEKVIPKYDVSTAVEAFRRGRHHD